MKTMLDVKGKSQFDQDIEQSIQSSACGPVTAFVIAQNHFPSGLARTHIDELYSLLGRTKIGLLKGRFIRNMRKILGEEWTVKECTIDEVKRQIDEGRPVAAKFDKWFNFRWLGHYELIITGYPL